MSAQPFWKTLLLGTLLIALGFILGCGKREPTQEEVLADAMTLTAAGEHAAAITRLELYLHEHPGALEVIDAVAFAYAESGDHAMAAYYFNRAAEVDPSQPEYLLYAAEALATIGDDAGVIDNYQRYLEARPQDRAVLIALAQLQAARGNRSSALDAYLQANRLRQSAAIQVELGRLYLASGNRAVAQTWFASAAQSDPEVRGDALLGLLEISLRAQRFADAEALVETLDREFPGRLEASPLADARRQLAQWRRSRDEAEAALAALRDPPPPEAEAPDSPPASAEGDSPSDVAAADARTEGAGDSVEADGQPREATAAAPAPTPIELFPETDSPAEQPPAPPPSNPTDYNGLVALARYQSSQGNFTEAIRNFQRALARNSDDPAIWRDLSQAQSEAGQATPAAASASEAVRRAPDNPAFLLHYLEVAGPALPPNRLLRELEAARLRFPEHPGIALALGRAYDEQGSRRYAGRMYQEFLRLSAPDHPDRPEIEAILNN